MHGVMKEFLNYLDKTWGWWLALILIASLWDTVGWWPVYMCIGLCIAGVLFPKKKKGRTASGDSYPYER